MCVIFLSRNHLMSIEFTALFYLQNNMDIQWKASTKTADSNPQLPKLLCKQL